MEVILGTIILAPFAASLLNYLFRIKHEWITIGAAVLSLMSSLFLLVSTKTVASLRYYFAGLPNHPFHLYADVSALILVSVITIIALCIFIYAGQYMKEEKGNTWFWGGISLFLSGMLLLVFAWDWLLFITAWEIMGAASYLLIATWHEKPEARQGSIKAFMLTRFTDMFLYAGIFVMLLAFGNTNIAHSGGGQLSTLGGIFLLIAVMGKSAQVPFQSWLSGAMAGPTPVSALLHSATMVAAGAILLFRIYPLLNNDVIFITGCIGGITILLTGITAITARDLKQLLAASTSSQLGFMLLAVGAGSPGAAFAHWIAHAFMKSSLFLGAGIFQHAYRSTLFKDINGAGKKLKATLVAFAIAAISLSGIAPLIGYWSKDAILSATRQSSYSILFFSIAIAGAFLTAVYMGKAVSGLWHGNKTATQAGPKRMLTGLFILIVFIVAGGFFLKPLVRSAGYTISSDTISKIAGIAVAIAGLSLGWFLKENWFESKAWSIVRDNYSIAGGYQKLIAAPVLKLADVFYKMDLLLLSFTQQAGTVFLHVARFARKTDNIVYRIMNAIGETGLRLSNVSRTMEEKGVEAGVYGISSSIKESGRLSRKLQTGLVHKELVITVAGVLVLIFILIAMIVYA